MWLEDFLFFVLIFPSVLLSLEKTNTKKNGKIKKTAQLLIFIFHLYLNTAHADSDCPQFIADSRTKDNGQFQSPGWPGPYPSNAICHYKLQGSDWQGIKITFEEFELEEKYKGQCLLDYLEISTVDYQGHRTFQGRYCGSKLPPPLLVLQPIAELEFHTNPTTNYKGFLASYEFLDEANVGPPRLNGTSPCGSIETGIGGDIRSPGYPNGYVAGLDCLWLIRVKYTHAIYIRIRELDFQGSISNCLRAQLTIYDGYENSLEDATVLKKFCGDFRHYQTEDERILLSSRNRLLLRFTSNEHSKPIQKNEIENRVGFRLIWADVEFDNKENCTKKSRFACEESLYCFTKAHQGGASSCPDLRHYCISSDLVCDGTPSCSEFEASDEKNCFKSKIVLTIIGAPLVFLVISLFSCYVCYKTRYNNRRPNETSLEQSQNNKQNDNRFLCWSSESENLNMRRENHHSLERNSKQNYSKKIAASEESLTIIPMIHQPISLKNDLESPMASDIVSPASGFSDTESGHGGGYGDLSLSHPHHNNPSVPTQNYCPAHGPCAMVPLRFLSRQFSLLPVVQELSSFQSDFEEEGSTYSSQNSDIISLELKPFNCLPPLLEEDSEISKGTSNLVNDWRMRQMKRVQRNEAVYYSDIDAKSSVNSSPASFHICPRCLEKEKAEAAQMNSAKSSYASNNSNLTFKNVDHHPSLFEKQISRDSGNQFDSGIELVDSTKNVSFDSTTKSSSDSTLSFKCPQDEYIVGRSNFCKSSWAHPRHGEGEDVINQSIQTDPHPNNGNRDDGSFTNNNNNNICSTFGLNINPDHGQTIKTFSSKATDV